MAPDAVVPADVACGPARLGRRRGERTATSSVAAPVERARLAEPLHRCAHRALGIREEPGSIGNLSIARPCPAGSCGGTGENERLT